MLLPLNSDNINRNDCSNLHSQSGPKILPGRVTIGEYDGKHPCLTAATTAEKVFIHNPHKKMGHQSTQESRTSFVKRMSPSAHEITHLNINQKVTSLMSGKMRNDSDRDYLMIGTPTNLLAFDVHDNKDVFYKDIEDGVNTMTIGKLGDDSSSTLVIIGGNCSIQGFDAYGNDPFWTVTGDNVSSMMLIDHNSDGKNELIVGSEDYEIRVFAQDEILFEITETESVIGLTPLKDGSFGYALANGTSKNGASSIFGFDIDGDGVEELVTGWSSGKLDARNNRSGEVIFKDNFNHPVAGITKADYRSDGKMQLVVCGSEGEVRGYAPLISEGSRQGMLLNNDEEHLRELSAKKQNLLLELKNYQENQKFSNTDKLTARSDILSAGVGVIPAQTQLQTSLIANYSGTSAPHVELSLSTTNETIIKCVLIFAEGIFDGECFVQHYKIPESNVKVAIVPPKDIPVDLHVKAFIGYPNSKNFHVFELTRQLPRFSMYHLLTKESTDYKNLLPSGHIHFKLNERISRIIIWLNQTFLLEEEFEAPIPSNTDDFEIKFVFLRKLEECDSEDEAESELKNYLGIHFKMTYTGDVNLYSDSIEVAGDFIQSLADFLGLDDLRSVVDFPNELIKLQENGRSFRNSKDVCSESRRFSAPLGHKERSEMVLTIVFEINRGMISNYKIRCHNHENLMNTLKNVNQIIQKLARLRVGKTKSNIITDSRTAIKDNNIPQLLKVMKYGDPVQ
ncbi:BBS2 [Lepeophtheirus salmonis]|uniref:BBS2 n=1 Tax=Lepeophtheirus salmonis TaxID=72036 RepID=A0A7R8CHW7_LEPSM|nr:BBS2 [Lepeophtheirus salmonis]CAF2826623.1 BBS2 [Lepeophtheirus salmonis]